VIRLLACMALAVLAPALCLAQAPDPEAERAAQTRLERVRAELREVAQVQARLASERDAASAQVREADQALAAQLKAQTALEAEVAEQRQRFEALEAERQAVAAGLERQRDALGALIRAAHVQGGRAPLRLLLSQDRLRDANRALAYHRYVQAGQVQRIRSLLEELAELARVTQRAEAQRRALDVALARELEALAALESRRADRAALLEALASQQEAQAQRVAELRRDERALLDLIESLRDIFADIPDQLDGARPFSQRRGQLSAPVPGRVLTAFGGSLPDGRRSEGWLLEAAAGETVTAVAPGRVAFSDWMNGYGLLLILDHGEGFLSLYAHNDGLVREVGDWVKSGEPLAQAGSSGGQGRAALYFELRRQGQPLDPQLWLRRRGAAGR
jgi:septal ring factor EnvC (AmiA/AmiB activator)